MAYTKYSLTPANNNAAPPDGAPEGMLPSAVNDTMRDMMAQIRDVGDGIRGGTYTMTAPVITGGSITGVALSGNTLTNPVITGGSINNTPIGASTASTGAFTNLAYTGTLTGGTGVINIGSGQFYKDASGNVGIANTSAGSFASENDSRLSVGTGSGNTGAITLYSGTTGHGAINWADGTSGAATYSGILRYDHNLNAMQFYTAGLNERMRLDSSGRLLVGLTSTRPNGGQIQASAIGQTGLVTYTNTTSGNNAAYFENPNGIVGAIVTSGTTTAYNTSSDYRLKENTAPMIGALDVVQQLKPVTYNWKADGSSGQGFIAHELQEVVPDCVTGEKDAVDAEGKPVYQGIDTSFLTATLSAAIQELHAIVKAQAIEIAELKAKI